jgi:XRE family aerobic/anaerobic benzoate catabolism transcriptional regulator
VPEARSSVLAVVAERVRAFRRARGLTQRELAERAELSPRFLAQVETGRGNISIERLAELAEALGVRAAELIESPTLASAPGKPPVIALLGLRGAGKSTIGKRLARRMSLPFIELDGEIERAAGLPLSQIFELHGERYYRRLEREVLTQLLSSSSGLVLATGGSLVNERATYNLLKRHAVTVWLRARPDDHWDRVVAQGDRRPMAKNPHAKAELKALLAAREPLYAEAAHTIDTSRVSVDAALDALVAEL